MYQVIDTTDQQVSWTHSFPPEALYWTQAEFEYEEFSYPSERPTIIHANLLLVTWPNPLPENEERSRYSSPLDSTLRAIDLRNGETIWEIRDIPGWIRSLSTCDESLYVATEHELAAFTLVPISMDHDRRVSSPAKYDMSEWAAYRSYLMQFVP